MPLAEFAPALRVRGASGTAETDRSALPAVHLRSRVPGTAGNTREQPTTSPSVFAGFPACSRLFSDYERIGETSSKTPERPATAGRDGAPATRWLPIVGTPRESGALVAASETPETPA